MLNNGKEKKMPSNQHVRSGLRLQWYFQKGVNAPVMMDLHVNMGGKVTYSIKYSNQILFYL
jgi:hypothetical protein